MAARDESLSVPISLATPIPTTIQNELMGSLLLVVVFTIATLIPFAIGASRQKSNLPDLLLCRLDLGDKYSRWLVLACLIIFTLTYFVIILTQGMLVSCVASFVALTLGFFVKVPAICPVVEPDVPCAYLADLFNQTAQSKRIALHRTIHEFACKLNGYVPTDLDLNFGREGVRCYSVGKGTEAMAWVDRENGESVAVKPSCYLAPIWGGDSVRHETVHIRQERFYAMLSREQASQVTLIEYVLSEFEAHFFGSTLLMLGVAACTAPLWVPYLEMICF